MYCKIDDKMGSGYIYSGHSGVFLGRPYSNEEKELLETDRFKELLEYKEDIPIGNLIVKADEEFIELSKLLVVKGELARSYRLIIIHQPGLSVDYYKGLLSSIETLYENGINIKDIYLYIKEDEESILKDRSFIIESGLKLIIKSNSFEEYSSRSATFNELSSFTFLIHELSYPAQTSPEYFLDFIARAGIRYYFIGNLFREESPLMSHHLKEYVELYFKHLYHKGLNFDLYLINIIKRLYHGSHIFYNNNNSFGYSYYDRGILYLNSPLLATYKVEYQAGEDGFKKKLIDDKASCKECFARFLCEIANSSYNFFIYNMLEGGENVKNCNAIKAIAKGALSEYLNYSDRLSIMIDNIAYYHPIL